MKENNGWINGFLIYNAFLVLLALIPVTFMKNTEIIGSVPLGVMFVADIICWLIVLFKARKLEKNKLGLIFLSLAAFFPAVSQWVMHIA